MSFLKLFKAVSLVVTALLLMDDPDLMINRVYMMVPINTSWPVLKTVKQIKVPTEKVIGQFADVSIGGQLRLYAIDAIGAD